jgi:hypothetical protein
MTELWKPIPGYEGLYEVSNIGRVRSVSRPQVTPTGSPYMSKPRIRKIQHIKGRNRVTLIKNNHRDTLQLARVIALAWIDGYQEGFTVDHIDGNKTNDDLSNLRWLSRSDNTSESYKTVVRSHHIPVTLTDSNGNTISFKNEYEADRFLGRSEGYIESVLRKSRNPKAHSTSGNYYNIKLHKGANINAKA